ncbi:MAG: LamG-like jellyroll fold domain-containing protein [Planctomycetota bacterium]|nr:LamG-like jellyroll fold domain-containing protein [Planctomycetota bacterium]
METPEPLPLEKWVKITMRFQKGVLSLAIDGAQVSEKKGDVESFASDHPLVLGTRFTGKMDNLLIQLDPE